VASHWYQSGACAIQTCLANACDVDDVDANGCECGNTDGAGAACGSAAPLGTLYAGGSSSFNGQLWPAKAKCGGLNTEDWFLVQFPSNRGVGSPGGAIPQVSVSGGAVMDLFQDCSGTGAACGSGSSASATSYSQRDNQSFCSGGGCPSAGAFRTHVAMWNAALSIRVRSPAESSTCGGSIYTLLASRPTECSDGATREFDSGEPCSNGCGPGIWRKRQTCRGGVWDAGANFSVSRPRRAI
jgi:hypothetical protein